VEKYIKPFSAAHLISDATDIGGLIKILNARSRTFVLVGSEVRGIVTLADLNKPPIRLYLFGLVSLFEMHLRFWIRKAYPDTSWQEFLKAKRVEKANDLQSRRRKRNQQIDVLDCLQLCDKQELFKKNQELVKMLEVVGGKKELDRFFTAVEDLRNRLAHSQQDLVEAPLGPT
jgi:hypothetical protein